ncbi:MAG: VIT domain-containing protein [Planctomycetota bacterium]
MRLQLFFAQRRSLVPRSIAAVFLFLFSSAAFADGFIIVHPVGPWPEPPVPIRPPRPVPPRERFALEVTRHKVSVDIDESLARTRVEETFSNPNDLQLEGDYLFPLPPGAAVSAFAMKIGGKEVTGEILEKERARRIYEDIVRRLKDPGLLEYVDRGLFRARVFPIPARGSVEVAIEYSEALARERGTATYRYPLDTGKYVRGGYQNVVIDIRLRSSLPIRSVQCPGYDAALVSRSGEKEARISFEAKRVPGDKDFLVTWNVSEDALAPVLIAYRGIDADGFFYLSIAPSPEKPGAAPAKDVVFAIDTSGSMLGVKMEQVKGALRYSLSNLNPADRFGIVDFSTEARRFREGLSPATEENRRAALAYVDELKARGGTNVEEALRFGLSDLGGADRLSILVLLTDGEPTVGVVQPDEILKTLKDKLGPQKRVFVFGVGDDLNAKLLDAVAREGRGAVEYVRPQENLEVPLARFYDKIDWPVLTGLELAFPGGDAEDWFPRPLPDLFRGEQLDVFGRYRSEGTKTVVLKGTYRGEPRVFEYSLPFEHNPAASYIPRLWAMRKVGYLLEAMRLAGEKTELKDEVIRLSKRYGVITPYTSYLIVEEDRMLSSADRPQFRFAARDAVVRSSAGLEPEARDEDVAVALSEVRAAARAAGERFRKDAGGGAVEASREVGGLKRGAPAGSTYEVPPAAAGARAEPSARRFQEVEGRTFYLHGTRWVDGALLDGKAPSEAETRHVKYLSDEYFALLAAEPGIGKILSLGSEVTFLWNGKAIAVDP